MDPKQFEEISKKLDMILRLLSLTCLKDLKSVNAKVEALSMYGFQPKEVAFILNKELNDIYQIQHKIRTKQASASEEVSSGGEVK
jgi:hypothetical protein